MASRKDKTNGQLSKEIKLLKDKIAELKKSKSKKHPSEESLKQYEKILSSSTDMIALLDNNFTYLAANTAYLEAVCKTLEELIGFTVEDVFGKKFFETVIKPNAIRCLSGKVTNYNEWFNFPVNGKRLMEINYYPYFDNQNKITGFVVNGRDITKRKLAEDKLKQSELWNKEIFEGSRDAIFIVDENAHFVDVNNAAVSLTGYSKVELLKMTVPDLHEEEDLAAYKKFFKDIIGGKSVISEAKLLRKDGTKIDAEFSNKQVLINGIPYMHSIARDITERKLTERSLQLTQVSVDNMKDAVYWLGQDAKFIYVNNAAVEALGYSKKELLTMTVHDIGPDFPAKVWAAHWAELKERKSFIIRTIHQRKNGSTFPVEITVNLVQFAGKEINCAIAKDISERIKNEENIKQKNEQLHLLSQASIEINKILDIPVILQQLTKIAIELTGSTSGAAALYEGKKMVFKKYIDNGKITDIDFKFEKGYGVPGWIIKTKKPYITNDAKNDKHVIKEIRERLNFHQLIDTPIFNKQGELLGCFEIHNTKDNRPYDENDIEILQGLSAITAVAIENAQIILERKNSEKENERQKETLNNILEGTNAGTWNWNVQTGEAVFNERWAEIMGKTLKELEPIDVNTWINNVHPDDLPKANAMLERHFNKEIDYYDVDFRQPHKDGGWVWVNARGKVVEWTEDGKPFHMSGTHLDITERKQAEKELEFKEQQLRLIYDSVGDIIFYLKVENDSQYRFISVNKTFLTATGLTEEKVVGKSIEQVIPESSLNLVRSNYKKAIQEKKIVSWEETSQYPTGIRTGIVSVAPVFDENKKCTHLIGSVHDITERVKNEEELKKSEATFKLLLEKLPNAVFLTILGGKNAGEIIYANPAAAEQTGYEQSKLIGMNIIHDFYVEKITIKLKESRENDLKKDKTLSFVEKKKHADGHIYITQTMVTPIDYKNEKTTLSVNTDITKQFEAQEKVKESENKYRSLFENNTAGVYVSSIAGKILNCNDAFVSMMGYSSKEEVLQTDAINFHQNKEEREIFLKKLKTKNRLLNFESIAKKKDGSYIHAIENVQLIGDNILQGTIVDITERKKAEIALKLSNEFNESLIETIPFGLDIVDMEGNILFMNNLLKDAVGIENPKGKCWEFYKDNGKQCTECPLKEEMRLGEINICEVKNVLGGREFEITHTSMNYKNQKAMLEIFRDITEERIAEKKIRQLSRGIEQSPEMIVITDIEGNIEYVNPRVTEITGYTQEEIIGKNPRIFQSGKTPKITYEELWETIIKGETWEGELLNKRKNGQEYWENERISPIINDKGETINYIAIKEDITERIKTRNKLIAAKEKAEEMNKIKSNFFANMSHELRTPLVGILGFTEILNETIEDKDLKEYAGMINQAGQRLLETLNLILNLSKIESENLVVDFSDVDVIETVKGTIKLFGVMAANKNLYIHLESDMKKFKIKTDERILSQIMNNLINNAIKFTKEGGVTIKVNKIKENSFIEIQVKDTGIGIAKEKQEIIWQAFRQVSEGASRKFEGTGLGLTVTKEFVQKLSGEIKLKSKVGKGSIFTVILPVNKNKEIAEDTNYNKHQNITHSNIQFVSAKGIQKKELLKVLYLEDDKNARNVVNLFLKDFCDVDLALNVDESIIKAINNKYDLFLVDINLKLKKGGIDFLNEIKKMKEYNDTPLIAVTAYTMADDKEKFLDKGFTSYISKPFSKKDLIELIKTTIREKG